MKTAGRSEPAEGLRLCHPEVGDRDITANICSDSCDSLFLRFVSPSFSGSHLETDAETKLFSSG